MSGAAAPMPTQVRLSSVQDIWNSRFPSSLCATVTPVPATSCMHFREKHASYRLLCFLLPGETARRRDPRLHTGIPCLSMKTVRHTCRWRARAIALFPTYWPAQPCHQCCAHHTRTACIALPVAHSLVLGVERACCFVFTCAASLQQSSVCRRGSAHSATAAPMHIAHGSTGFIPPGELPPMPSLLRFAGQFIEQIFLWRGRESP